MTTIGPLTAPAARPRGASSVPSPGGEFGTLLAGLTAGSSSGLAVAPAGTGDAAVEADLGAPAGPPSAAAPLLDPVPVEVHASGTTAALLLGLPPVAAEVPAAGAPAAGAPAGVPSAAAPGAGLVDARVTVDATAPGEAVPGGATASGETAPGNATAAGDSAVTGTTGGAAATSTDRLPSGHPAPAGPATDRTAGSGTATSTSISTSTAASTRGSDAGSAAGAASAPGTGTSSGAPAAEEGAATLADAVRTPVAPGTTADRPTGAGPGSATATTAAQAPAARIDTPAAPESGTLGAGAPASSLATSAQRGTAADTSARTTTSAQLAPLATAAETTVPAQPDPGAAAAVPTSSPSVSGGSGAEQPLTHSATAPAPPPAGPAQAVSPAAPAAAPPAPPPAAQVFSVLAPVLEGPDGTYAVALQLYPEELGAVQVDVLLRSGEIRLALHAGDDAAQQVLRAALPDLRAELSSAGLQATLLSVDGGRSEQQPSPQQDRLPRSYGRQSRSDDSGRAVPSPVPTPTSPGDSALDLRM